MNINKIYEKLKEFNNKYDLKNKEEIKNLTASSIADVIGIKRNVVSHYLNILNENGKVIKVNKRPVYFIDKDILEQKYNMQTTKKEFGSLEEFYYKIKKVRNSGIFTKLIGYNGSLKHQINQCKSAAVYPPNGLPLLLHGPTGTGKSYIAQLIYEYAKEMNVIEKNAPFNVLNCADYANNPELLSANLFGYVKGAFTGADNDKFGIIEKSNGGFLFLDEIHRLNAEGQEKLFILMDKSIYTRLGESGNWHNVNVRLIFATTENIEKKLIGTFLRRIPIIINIPNLMQRGENEKLKFIYTFFHEEALNIKKNIKLTNRVITTLLKNDFKGNVGELRNVIKYTCANAYTNQSNNEFLQINLNCLPDKVLIKSTGLDETFNYKIPHKGVIISPNYSIKDLYFENNDINLLEDIFNNLLKVFQEYKNKKITMQNFLLQSTSIINNYFDKIVFSQNGKKDNEIRFEMIKNTLTNVLDFMSKSYGLKFYGNSALILSYYLSNRFNDNVYIKMSVKAWNDFFDFIRKEFQVEFKFSKKLIDLIESSLDIKCSNEDIIIITFFIKMTNMDFKSNKIKAVIVAHGYSTASSIANVANRFLGQNIFEAFDMPIDMPIKDIVTKLQEYLKTIDTSNGLIILVDMGSLEEIYVSLQDKTTCVIGIINNVTTQLALDIGSKILNDFDIKTITEESSKSNISDFKLIFPKRRKIKAIITTCITGIGTAIKIKDLLDESIKNNIDIETIACDYFRLKTNGIADELFNEYEILAIVGTADPGIKDVKYIALEDIISGSGEKTLYEVFHEVLDDDNINKLNMNIIKVFSLERVLDTLTILNPNKIINYIEEAINKLQKEMKIKFNNDLIISLYIHLSCLIERLVTKSTIESYNDLENFEKCHKEFINIVHRSFSVIESVYNVNIVTSEIGYIHDIIALKIKDLKY